MSLKDICNFLSKFYIAKTPSYVDFKHPLIQIGFTSYFIESSARSIGAYVLTNNKEFLRYSNIAIHPKDFFQFIKEYKSNANIPFINLKDLNLQYYPQIEILFDDIIAQSNFICGKYVHAFEKTFAEYLGIRHCIAVNSGTSALIVSLLSIGLKPGDEVILPVNTFIATAEAISLLGGKPVFVDIDERTYNINPNKIEEKITSHTRAIIPVHLYGQCADMDPILEIAKKYKLWVIEDACQAHGAEYKSKKAGTIGHIGCFSFYPSKNLGAWGEGGAIVTNNHKLAEKMYKIRNHGSTKKYQHDIIGGNFRMEEFQAAVLLVKLKDLDTNNEKRRKIAFTYTNLLKNIKGIIPPFEAPYIKHVYHLYVVRIISKNRNLIETYLKNKNIETLIHYPLPIHLQPAYSFLRCNKKNFPVAEKIAKEILSLPIYPELKEEKIKYVIEALNNII
ncbi:MAG: DegT/DnrJ/EryC1/StrS family aminotransferase [Candidatus Desulfofervidus auxilii]|nr:DegT/DnrJ/EryC1/StrS family aminotransferase [Candidatus Desulfofervidus auxilii]